MTVEGARADRSGASMGPAASWPTAVGQLEQQLDGRLLAPGAPGYDAARRVFNAMIDRHPALIACCRTAEDVVRGVTFARDHELPLAVKAGGHGVAGKAVCDEGLVLDLSPMRAVAVDRAEELAVAQPGLTLGELDAATQVYGLATPTGVMSGTGLSGLALGGGLGWLSGRHGLTCDNLIAAEMVTADGERLMARAESHPDLFWALRGGGGNFGVVTAFTLRLHRVQSVRAGAFIYGARRARDALRLYRYLATECADHQTVNASLSVSDEGTLQASIAVCQLGDSALPAAWVRSLRRLGPRAQSIEAMPYLAWQRVPDPGFPAGQQHYWRSGHVTAIADELIEVLVELAPEMPSPQSGVGLQQLHGAAGRVQPGATAYAHRGDRFDLLILSQWPDPRDSERNIAWTRELFEAIEPWLEPSVYVNNLGEEGEERVRQAYGPNYARLVDVKTMYDPTNLFAQNQNVRPIHDG
jgi:FAD/FMN-containing dehydrogenase